MATENDNTATENGAAVVTTAVEETPVADFKGKGKAVATADDVQKDVAMDEDDDEEDEDDEEVSLASCFLRRAIYPGIRSPLMIVSRQVAEDGTCKPYSTNEQSTARAPNLTIC